MESQLLDMEHLPELEGHVSDFHLDLLFEALLSGELEKPLGHLLVNLGVPLAGFQLVVEFLPHVQEGLHFAVGPVRGPPVFLAVAWHQVAETIVHCHFGVGFVLLMSLFWPVLAVGFSLFSFFFVFFCKDRSFRA